MTDSELLLAMSDLLDTKLDAKLQPIKNDIKSIRDEQKRTNDELNVVKHDLTSVKDELNAVKHDLTSVKDELNAVKHDLASVKDELNAVKDELAVVKVDQLKMKDELTSVKNGLTRLNLIVENNVQNSINILVENYVPAARRYQETAEQIKAIQAEQDIMKKVLQKHGEILQKIS